MTLADARAFLGSSYGQRSASALSAAATFCEDAPERVQAVAQCLSGAITFLRSVVSGLVPATHEGLDRFCLPVISDWPGGHTCAHARCASNWHKRCLVVCVAIGALRRLLGDLRSKHSCLFSSLAQLPLRGLQLRAEDLRGRKYYAILLLHEHVRSCSAMAQCGSA
jgi:hypothetical protein